MKFCTNCGKQLPEGARFCAGCGSLATQETTTNPEGRKAFYDGEVVSATISGKRQQEYVGTVFKCSNCGCIITQTTAVCPDCGIRITGRSAVSSVQQFNNQLMEIEASRKPKKFGIFSALTVDPTDTKKLSLIRSFPIPNTIDDILEFMLLAVANIDVGLSKNTVMNRWNASAKSESSLTIDKTISDAWVSKMQQAYQKAEITFPNDPAFKQIQKIYFDKMKELKIKVKV